MPVALGRSETLNALATWAASGVCLVRDTGSPGGSVLQFDVVPGLPRLQAAGRSSPSAIIIDGVRVR